MRTPETPVRVEDSSEIRWERSWRVGEFLSELATLRKTQVVSDIGGMSMRRYRHANLGGIVEGVGEYMLFQCCPQSFNQVEFITRRAHEEAEWVLRLRNWRKTGNLSEILGRPLTHREAQLIELSDLFITHLHKKMSEAKDPKKKKGRQHPPTE